MLIYRGCVNKKQFYLGRGWSGVANYGGFIVVYVGHFNLLNVMLITYVSFDSYLDDSVV